MSSSKKVEEISWFLYFAVVIANLASLTVGIQMSWPSSSLEKLKSNSSTENPLDEPITISETSLVTSLMSIGGLFGSPLVALFSDRIGRKNTLILGSSFVFASHFVIAFATKLWHIYLGRFAGGIYLLLVYTLMPIYISEISEKHNRGYFGTFMIIFSNFGKFAMFCLGPYMTLQMSALITLIPACMFLVIYTMFIPESPYYLVAKGRLEDARGVLKKLRRNYEEKEMEEIQNFVEDSLKNTAGVLDLFKNKMLRRSLLISIALLFFQQFSGIYAILGYLQGIFTASGSSLPPEISAIIIGLVQFLASFIPSFIVDRYGRRFLLITSSLLACISLTTLGASFMIESSSFSWLPLVSLIVFEIAYNLGLGPISFVVIGELFPPHVKGLASSISVTISCIFTMLTTFLYPLLTEEVGDGPAFWCFAVCCALSAIFVYFKVPDTKGKSLSDIYIDLKK